MTIKWIGKVEGENKRLGINKQGRFYSQNGYKKFINSLIQQINIQHAQEPMEKFEGLFDIYIKMSINNKRDHLNLLKPILDALQKAHIISNDKNVADTYIKKPNRHKMGELDTIEIIIVEHNFKDEINKIDNLVKRWK